ncbi:element excision factor XisH family protein [Candidatus Parabeggiatoa sp. HSG14]|uniref:element excision factor XisH family protein n=1 Tax=Candidatus Parabeggiatoa sp. HSG14 TaxID=3055593 RepID=UPI0025A85ED0|nr:element excision factor XisH family protein [Thiotrichales bacterium HSG14]
MINNIIRKVSSIGACNLLHLSYGGRNVYVDLGAEQPIGAEKEGNKIAVEVKSFVGESDVHELGQSIVQYNMYRDILSEIESERDLHLAVPSFTFGRILSELLGQLLIRKEQLKLIIFEETKEIIRKWIG